MKSNIEELQKVEDRLMDEKERRMYERYQTIRLFLLGHSVKQITTILNRTDKTIHAYIKSYEKHGLDGLTMEFSSGKPPRLAKE